MEAATAGATRHPEALQTLLDQADQEVQEAKASAGRARGRAAASDRRREDMEFKLRDLLQETMEVAIDIKEKAIMHAKNRAKLADSATNSAAKLERRVTDIRKDMARGK